MQPAGSSGTCSSVKSGLTYTVLFEAQEIKNTSITHKSTESSAQSAGSRAMCVFMFLISFVQQFTKIRISVFYGKNSCKSVFVSKPNQIRYGTYNIRRALLVCGKRMAEIAKENETQ